MKKPKPKPKKTLGQQLTKKLVRAGCSVHGHADGHVHVTLPSGAIANVAPNCSRKTLKALDQMTQHVKNVAEFNPPKNWGKVDGKVVRNEALNAAIDRGERLAKIAEICKDDWEIGQTLPWHKLVQIYQLAKGVK